jgi:TatD DNase family protein
MIDPLAELGAYFSFSGHFLQERKAAARENFREVPPDRLLIETDAPDMAPPPSHDAYATVSPAGEPVNHPGNLAGIYRFVAEMLARPLEELAAQVRENFERLFAGSVAQQ